MIFLRLRGILLDRIIILDEALVNKIAAGEVIERPASAIKELVENSIDARSKKIFVEVKEGGKVLIKVSDDGTGMSKNDAELSWQRHATSKIKEDVDLFSIRTLGFRGEALASIAGVSEMTLISRQEEDISGIKILLFGGKEISSESIGCSRGTTIEIKNLFYNTPARKKYLKSDVSESEYITDVIMRYALIYPDIHFKLMINGKEIINSPASPDWLTRIGLIYGNAVAKDMLEVFYADSLCTVSGFISKPLLSRSTKTDQSIYVNKRYIKKNIAISDAINNAYHTMMMVNRYPVAVLNIVVSPEKTDVNVHPQKSEIRIEDEKRIYDSVFSAVKETLADNDLIPVSQDLVSDKKITEYSSSNIDDSKIAEADKKYYTASPAKQTMLVKDAENLTVKNLPEIGILGIVNKTYIIAEITGSLILIDQHAAAERILYEKFTEQLRGNKVVVQELLNKEIIELNPKLFQAVMNNSENLLKLGYKVEEFGNNTIRIDTIPVILGKQFDKQNFLDFVEDLGKEKIDSLEKFFHSRIARMACRTAIKAGDEITLPQIKSYIQELCVMNIPYTCPHGRPIMIKLPFYELEKMFKRVV
jgi:DNA mismatch repair protein MutL